MHPTSRRKKKYDEQLRGFQNRNIVAGVLLLIFVGLAIWLTIRLMPGAKPTVFVSTNYIDHSGSREIPFAQQSCQLVRNAFGQQVQSELLDVHQVDQQNSALELPKERLGKNGVLVVYLNGHLIDQPEPDSEQASVGFLGPEAALTQKDLGDMLKQIDKSPAKLKLVFLDAGRYSWSPIYPNRPLNKFSSSLAKALKNRHWGPLSDNFWVITSHSDQEISRVSTPLETSLFAKAIAESVAEMADSDHSKLRVIELFERVRQRTTSWSRNFKNHSLQTPVLIRPDVGVVTDELADDYRAMEFAVNWKHPPKPDPNSNAKPPVEPSYLWQSFASRMSGKQAAERMLTKDYFDAAPFKEFQGIESFIELGNEFGSRPDSNDYQNALGESRTPPSGNTLFDLRKLEAKHLQTRRFRQSILGMAILERFQNEMQFWEDDTAINQLEILAKPSIHPDPAGTGLDDSTLRIKEKLPSAVDQYAKEFQDYLRLHTDLIEMVDRRLRRSSQNTNGRLPLTPTQVELLGRTSQRYLPLITALKPKPPADATTPVKKNDELDFGSLTFDLEVEASTSKFGLTDGLSIKDLHDSATKRMASQAAQQASDTGYRFLLAAGGSESTLPRPGIAPQIRWTPVEPSISISSSVTQFRVNPFDLDPLPLSVSAQAVELVDLSLSMDGVEIPTGLEFGLSSKFERKRPITFEDGDLSQQRTKSFEVYFRHRRPDSLLGKPIPMKLTVTSGDGALEPVELHFAVTLTRDPTVQLHARRETGVGESPATQASLIRWGGKLPDRWLPLTLNSLANVRSAFEFSLINNSSRPKTLRAELYNVIDLPPDFGSSQIHADRPNSDQIQELASWLFKQQDRPGATSLQKSNQSILTLIAETQPTQVPPGGTPVPAIFSVPMVGEKKEPTEASLLPQSVKQGMLIAFYEDDESDQPAWFQWLVYEPKEPADATVEKGGAWLQPLADVLDVFQQNPDPSNPVQRNKTERSLTKSWIPAGTKDKPRPAASLTTVSEIAYQQNRHFENSLTLKNIFQGQSLIPNSRERPALLLLNLLGIPNYGIFELRGESINQASFRDRLTGIRVASLPNPAWECYPQTWSLIGSNKILKTTNDSDVQDIYLRRPDNAASGQIQLELLLPILKGKVLGKDANDFELAWRNGNIPKLFPNRREHFVEANEAGLNFWSTVRAHFLTDSSDSFTNESVLKIRRTTGRREILGSWRFITRPPTGPGVSVRLSKDATTTGQLPQITVEVDLSQAKPPLDLQKVSLSVDGTSLKNTARFLQDPARMNQPGKFRFPYNDLVKELGVDKVGTHEIQINARTFFNIDEAAVARLEIKPTPKPTKVKTAPVLIHVGKVTLTFEDASGDPLGEVTEFKDLRVDGKKVPWAQSRKLVAGQIVASGQASTKKVLVYEIKQGKHNVEVTAIVDGSTFVATGPIEIKSSGQVFKLKLAKTK